MGARVILGAVLLPNGRKVGQWVLDDDGTWLEKQVNYTKHHYHSGPGWALDAAHVRRLRDMGGTGVRLVSHDATCLWWASLNDFEDHARLLTHGHGGQLMLPDAYWHFTETVS